MYICIRVFKNSCNDFEEITFLYVYGYETDNGEGMVFGQINLSAIMEHLKVNYVHLKDIAQLLEDFRLAQY